MGAALRGRRGRQRVGVQAFASSSAAIKRQARAVGLGSDRGNEIADFALFIIVDFSFALPAVDIQQGKPASSAANVVSRRRSCLARRTPLAPSGRRLFQEFGVSDPS